MLFRYEGSAHVTKDDISAHAPHLEEYTERLSKVAEADNYAYEESSINLPFDGDVLEKILKTQKKYVNKKLKYVLDIGIGGSNLGTKAIYDAFHGYFDLIEPGKFPKMIFADTNDPSYIYKLYEFIRKKIKDPEEILINAVSKSGKTTETIVNLEIITSGIPFAKDRLVITTAYNSDLWKAARSLNLDCLPIPNKVGGRFSVFSSVGLFPLAAAGIDITELLEGAMEARKICLTKNVFKNPAALSAIILFENYVKGKLINDNFIFHPELESLGKWYRQLLAESVGKDGKGITPTVSIGSTDLHSMGQLYLGGIKDKFFTFISAKKPGAEISVPQEPVIEILSEVEEKSTAEIMSAILAGVKLSFAKKELPFVEIILDEISLESLGQFMQFKMIEIMYLGELFGVNAFDQPNVESYKQETRKILLEK
jgi:glucose-6-phosphate isomerase